MSPISTGSARDAESGPPPLSREPFGVVDQVTCYFDTRAEPANVHLEMCLPGRLDHGAFTAAAAAAVTAHPRVNSRRAASHWFSRNYEWEHPASIDAGLVSFTTFTDETELAAKRNAFLAQAPSIDRSPPVSMLVASGPEGDYVILNAHHALIDGLSSVQLLRDVGRHYRAEAARRGLTSRSTSDAVPDRPAEPAGVGSQATPADKATALLRRPAGGRAELAAAGPSGHGPASRLPARIAQEHSGQEPSDEEPSDQRGCGVCLLPVRDVPVVPSSPGFRASLNDALVTAMVMTVGRWNGEHGKKARIVRITMPINARPAERPRVIGNFSRIVPITGSPPGSGADAGTLLADVAQQARHAKDTPGPQVGLAIRSVAAAWCPTTVKRRLIRAALRLAGPFVCDTAMVTNLGDVPDPPDFSIPGPMTMAFSAPAPMPRGLSVGVITVGNRMVIALRHNRALLDEAAAARFGAGFAQALEELTSPARDASSGPTTDRHAGPGSMPRASGSPTPV